MLGFLHTWGQNLSQHIHLHCLIPGGALCETVDGMQWNISKKSYLFPNRVMSKLFGKLFISGLQKAYTNHELTFKGGISNFAEQKCFSTFQSQLAKNHGTSTPKNLLMEPLVVLNIWHDILQKPRLVTNVLFPWMKAM